MIGTEPCRENHAVDSSPAATRRASAISNARSPAATIPGRSPEWVKSSSISPYERQHCQSSSSCAAIISARIRRYKARAASESRRDGEPAAQTAVGVNAANCCARESRRRPHPSGSVASSGELLQLGGAELIPRFPCLVTDSTADPAVPLALTDLLEPEEPSRGIEHPQQAEMIPLVRARRELQHGSGPVEDLCLPVEDEVVVGGHLGIADGPGVGIGISWELVPIVPRTAIGEVRPLS